MRGVFPVHSNTELDLCGVVSPVCILKCKSTLQGLPSGSVLDVLVGDPEVVKDLVKIIERSRDRVIGVLDEDNRHRVRIERH
jgi:TusA-related sulfurtransferase